jgi:hypothetical protein
MSTPRTKDIFLKTQTFRNLTSIQDDVDDKYLASGIRKAQDLIIRKSLGDRLYKRIVSDLQNTTLSGDYLDLFENYIIPCLVEYSLYYVSLDTHYKITNQSILTKRYDQGDAISSSDFKYLRDNIRTNAENYLKLLVEFLIYNSELFAEYGLAEKEEKQPSNNTYNTGMYIPGSSNNSCNDGIIGWKDEIHF